MTSDTNPAVTVVTAPEEITIYNADQVLRRPLREALESGASVVVADLNRTEFMDAVSMGILVGALKLAERQGARLGIARSPRPPDGEQLDRVLRLFRVMGLEHRVFDIRASAGEFGTEEAGAEAP